MREPTIAEELPEGFELEAGASGILALSHAYGPALRAAGYGLDSDGRTRPSALAGRRPLLELPTPSGTFLIRRFSHGGLLRFVTGERYSDRDRPFRELRVSARLARDGVRTPEIAAARARPAGGFGWRLEIVTRRVEGAIDVDEALARVRSGRLDRRAIARIAASAGALVRAMHASGCLHADLTTKNLLVAEAALGEARPTTWVLDLDRATLAASPSRSQRRANLARLHRYVLRGEREAGCVLSRTDWARFLAAYEPDRGLRKEDARAVLRTHAQHRTRHALGRLVERWFRGPPRNGSGVPHVPES